MSPPQDKRVRTFTFAQLNTLDGGALSDSEPGSKINVLKLLMSGSVT
jgi:hypothetical protein